jgi:nucleoside phosphorylase
LPGALGSVAQVLGLQRLAGNQYVARRVSRPFIQREIGRGKSGWIVKHDATDVEYVAYARDADEYDLRPVVGGTTVRVAATNKDYSAVREEKAADLKDIKDESERHTKAGESAQWSVAAARRALAQGDFDTAFKMFERAEEALPQSVVPASGPTRTEAQLVDALKAVKPYGDTQANLYKDVLLLPVGVMQEVLKAEITKAPKRLGKYRILNIETDDAVQSEVATKMQTGVLEFRTAPLLFEPFVPLLVTLIKQQKIAAFNKAMPPLVADPEFRAPFVEMTTVKHKQETTSTTLYDEVLIKKVAPTDTDRPAVRLKYDVLYHLGEKIDEAALSKSMDEILKDGIKKKSERLQFLFEDSPKLIEDAAKQVKETEINQLLLDIKKGKPHSIQDINDYVGDKLSDPLMKWIIEKRIPVEVHATSLLASFAKLKGEGFTDVIEIPSSHTGTKKYVASNPQTGKAKVVYQTLAGTSYAIQTTGAFLFYEIYSVEPDLPKKQSIATETKFVHAGYKARNVIEKDDTGKIAKYLLVGSIPTDTLIAEVPYVDRPHKIASDGSITLVGVGLGDVAIHKVTVKTLPLEQLKVFTEDIDYTAAYLDVFRTYGVNKAEIAAIGRKGELKKMLAGLGVAPTKDVDLPYFNMTVFELKGEAPTSTTSTTAPTAVLLLFGISPDFFGDKAGFLAAALETIGVKHITFVGTAGGLAPGLAKGDLIIANELQNAATGKLTGTAKKNQAAVIIDQLKVLTGVETAKVKGGGVHVGVHSPITESHEMIEWMQTTKISSVDCEAGFIADALKTSDVSLYHIFYISDLPGTQESIGLGGTAGDDVATATTPTPTVTTAPTTGPTELMVQHIIKSVVKGKIESAARVAETNKYPITKDGKIKVKFATGVGPTDVKDGLIGLQVALPAIAKESNLINVLKLLATKISKVLDTNKGVVRLDEQAAINDLARTFYGEHKVRVIVTFEQ